MSAVLAISGVKRTFAQAGRPLEILKGVSLSLGAGEMVGLLGPSGSGKSTLLHIAGLLEHPNAGEVKINGRASSALSSHERTLIRRNEIGFVYQFHHLLGEFTALENVMMPMRIAGFSKAKASSRAKALLKNVGLAE
ncbi:MAG: ABC transporter ATP-binding protein, partial [Alphaproteobacteria bacterium]